VLTIITKRKVAEVKLRESRNLYRTLVEALPEVVIFADMQGNLEFVSPNIEKLSLKEPQAEVIGTSIFDWIAPEQHREVHQNFRQLIEEDYQINVYRFIRSDGTDFLGKVHSGLVKDAHGQPKRIVSIIQDTTEEIESIRALRTSEERFRDLFEQAQVGMAIIDDRGLILQANPSIMDMLGYTTDKIRGLELLQLMPKKRQRKARAEIKNLMAGKLRQLKTEMKFMKNDGATVHVLLQIIKLDQAQSDEDKYLCQLVNIDAIKRAESELKIRNEELNNIVYKVSHDLKAPLHSVKGLINIMRLESDLQSHYSYLNLIEERIQKLETFIADILSHSRNLNVGVQLSEIEVAPLIEQCFNQIAYHSNYKHIEKILDIGVERIYTDEIRMYEIMRNLVANAVIYSCPAKRESFVKVSVHKKGQAIQIDVQDNGLGIDQKHIDRIFQMFYRANAEIEGTGIGLYIVQQSIEKIGGTIKVASELGKGSIFSIELPNLKAD